MPPASIKKFLVTASTAAALFCPAYGPVQIPETYLSLAAVSDPQRHPWENLIDSRYQSSYEESKAVDQIAIIHNFAKRLLLNSNDLVPEIVAIVDESFWELL